MGGGEQGLLRALQEADGQHVPYAKDVSINASQDEEKCSDARGGDDLQEHSSRLEKLRSLKRSPPWGESIHPRSVE